LIEPTSIKPSASGSAGYALHLQGLAIATLKDKARGGTGILTDADLPRASWKLELSSAGYQKPGTAKLRARERVLALPEQLAL